MRAGGAYAPRLSVVIPTRDRYATLVPCLRRLAAGTQTLSADDYEVIVADDGNADATRLMLAVEFPDVIVVPGPRRGPAANRNAGAKAAEGEWLVFTDDDTLPDSRWLEEIVAASEGVEVVEGRTTCSAGLRSPLEHAPINETGGLWWSCNIAVRRDVFDRLGGFDERYRIAHMEDPDLRERALKRGIVARFAPQAVVDHPPRRVAWGNALASTHYYSVLFSTIHGRPLSLISILRTLTINRVRAVLGRPALGDGVSAAASWFVEVLHVVTHWNAWRATAAREASP